MSELLGEWQSVALGEAAYIVMGQSPPSEDYNTVGAGKPFLQGKAEFTHFNPKPTKHCTKALKIAGARSVLMSVRAPVGDVNMADQDYIIGRGLAALRLKEGDDLFLFYTLLHSKERIAALGSGSTFQSINRSTLVGFEIMLPSLSQQRAIAASLSAVQEARDTRRHELAVERERKAALMAELFSTGVRAETHKETEIGPLPQSWQVESLGNVAQVSSGGTPDRKNPEYWAGSIPWVKTGEITYNTIYDTEEKITEQGLQNSSARILPAGTLLMAMYGQGVTRGRVALLGIDAAINQACAALRFDLTRVEPRFAFYYLAKSYDALRTLGHGANQTNLNASHVKAFAIPLPSLGEQQNIATILAACDSKIGAMEVESALHDELFRALLDELLSGRILSHPLIENGTATEGEQA